MVRCIYKREQVEKAIVVNNCFTNEKVQGTQVSTATQRAATTTRYRHTEKLSGDTYQPVYLPWLAKREERGGANGCTNAQIRA